MKGMFKYVEETKGNSVALMSNQLLISVTLTGYSFFKKKKEKKKVLIFGSIDGKTIRI